MVKDVSGEVKTVGKDLARGLGGGFAKGFQGADEADVLLGVKAICSHTQQIVKTHTGNKSDFHSGFALFKLKKLFYCRSVGQIAKIKENSLLSGEMQNFS